AAANPGWPDDLRSWHMHREIAGHILPAQLVWSRETAAHRTVVAQIRYRHLIGDFQDARQLGELAVGTWGAEDFLGPDDEFVLRATNEWANALRAGGSYQPARALTSEALRRLRAKPGFGGNHPDTLAIAAGYAADLRIAGDYVQALA